VVDGRLVLLAQVADADGRYRLYASGSTDGVGFSPLGGAPVFEGTPGGWDAFSIATFRVVSESAQGWTAMYAGSASRADEPNYFGLARSKDFLHWEKHPGNPVFGRGSAGEPDGGAIWYPAIQRREDGWHMLYEGSEGDYAWGLNSQICAAFLANDLVGPGETWL
jgi:hypothetical protein